MTDFYEDVDRHGVVHRIERRFDPSTPLNHMPPDHVVRWPPDDIPEQMSGTEFDEMLSNALPPYVRDDIDRVLDESVRLAEDGKAEQVPSDRASWRRGIVLSWHHSFDIASVCLALGHPRDVAGTHDLYEFVPAGRIQDFMEEDPAHWYREWAAGLSSSDPVNIGFLNPYFCASLTNWGSAKVGRQNAMDAHRLSSHHIGHPEAPQDWIEKAVNFVFHHLPREHFGIRHEPLADWDQLDDRLAHDPAIKDDPIGKRIVADIRIAIEHLEAGGFLTPWHRLDLDRADVPALSRQHSSLVLGDHQEHLARCVEVESARARQWLDALSGPAVDAAREVFESVGKESQLPTHRVVELQSRTAEEADLVRSVRASLLASEALHAIEIEESAERLAEVLGVAESLDVPLPVAEEPRRLCAFLGQRESDALGRTRHRGSSSSGSPGGIWQKAHESERPTLPRVEAENALADPVVRTYTEFVDFARPMLPELDGVDAEELLRELYRQMVSGPGVRVRSIYGQTVLRLQDIRDVLGSIGCASALMLFTRHAGLPDPVIAGVGGLAMLAMVVSGIRTARVKLEARQVAVLGVLVESPRVALTPERVQAKLSRRWRAKLQVPDVLEVLTSLTRTRDQGGEVRPLAFEEDGKWRGIADA